MAGVAVLACVGLSAQAQQSAAPAGMAELLTEVRALRADLNQAAGASMRMQLLVARLSLQEQRVNTVGHQLTDVTAKLDAAVRARTEVEARIKNFENAVAARTAPADQLRDMENNIASEKGNLRPLQAREQQLRSQAGEVENLLTAEQNRWSEFNGRLDDLERSLPAATGR
jgi:chromosome segregation ATPase